MTRGIPTGRTRVVVAVLLAAATLVVVPMASEAAGPASISFGAAGDFGANSATAASLNELNASGVDYFMTIGDLDYGEVPTPADWCNYITSRLPTLGPSFPFQVLAGNHEEDSIFQHAACLPDRLGSTGTYGAEYAFDYPPAGPLVRTIMISPALTINNVSYSYSAGSTRYNWVAAQIDDARADGIPWVVVGMHKHCFLASSSSCEIGADLMNLLVAKRVDLVIQGHKHTYQRSKQLALGTGCTVVTGSVDADCVVDDGADGFYSKGRGTLVLIIGCFGKGGSSSPGGYFVRAGSGDGFTKFTVTADRMDATFVNATGSFADAYSIVPNQPPSVTNPGAQTHNEQQTVSLPIVAVDPEGGQLAFTATGLPPGLTVNATTGVISGTLSLGSIGSYTTRVTATDPGSLASTVQFTWTVRDPPPATPAGFTLIRHTTGVAADWNDNLEPDFAGYNIFRSASAGGTYTKLNGPLLTASEYFDAAAPTGATSYYRVVAVDDKGNASSPASGSALRSKITFVGSATGTAGIGGTLALAKPPGVVAGDVMLAGVMVRGSIVLTPPAGWAIASDTLSLLTLTRQVVFAHLATASEPASYSFASLGLTSMAGNVVAYRGASEAVSRAAGQTNTVSEEITAPSVTPAAAGSVQVGFFGIEAAAEIAAPVTMLLRAADMGASPVGIALAAADIIVDASAVPARVAYASEAAANIGQVIVLAPRP